VSLSLVIKLPNTNDYTFFDCVTGSFNNDEESSKVGLMKAIESAHTKWGINLIKEPFTINSMISVNQDTIKNNLN